MCNFCIFVIDAVHYQPFIK
ncbi:MAG TPA: erythromycin resistance leader peptide [Aliicoccus persicus]|uniref:Erythromycin resistance leader peptide n=1 Tax=Aliicoccus persicus TaxID=930138 RepID=A0A921JAV5_9STAP|nr:erythromycin resistance leader peptide [Aliicoccus persicus]